MAASVVSKFPKKTSHVVLYTSIGLGHLIPFAELAVTLARNHECKITFVTFEWDSTSRQNLLLSNLASTLPDMDIIKLKDMDLDNKAQKPETAVSEIMGKATGPVEAVLRNLTSSPDGICALIIDVFCSSIVEVAATMGIPVYYFCSMSAATMALGLALPQIIATTDKSFKDCDYYLHVDGLPPVHTKDVPEPLQDRESDNFSWLLWHFSCLRKVNGILLNTFTELEPEHLSALLNPTDSSIPPVYAVGPIVFVEKTDQAKRSECLRWLDTQPPGSVLYVSFGSGVTFSKEQVTEIAEGLRRSRQRFLWVVRRPMSDDAASTYISTSHTEVTDMLPAGFVEETKDVGMVVPDWAPQSSILCHGAIGGFLSHGGWNSTLESIWNGVPMIVWPVFAEQRLNRTVLVDVIGVAFGVKTDDTETKTVKREEVERCVRELMESGKGREVKERVREMMEKGKRGVAPGGPSYGAMAELVSTWQTININGSV